MKHKPIEELSKEEIIAKLTRLDARLLSDTFSPSHFSHLIGIRQALARQLQKFTAMAIYHSDEWADLDGNPLSKTA